jgi:hypothetical protein
MWLQPGIFKYTIIIIRRIIIMKERGEKILNVNCPGIGRRLKRKRKPPSVSIIK